MTGGVQAARRSSAVALLSVLLLAPSGAADETAERESGEPAAPTVKAAGGDALAPARGALRQGRDAEAARLLQERLAAAPADREARHLLVQALLSVDDVAGAAAAAEVAREEAPDHPLTFLGLADVMTRRGQLAGAERFYREATRRDAALAPGHLGLGRLLRSQGQRRSALAAYRKAYELAPSDTAVLLSLASLTPDPDERLGLTRKAREIVEDPALRLRLDEVLPVLEALGEREPCRLVAPADSIALPLPELDFHQRSLEGAVAGGRDVPFLLDTGASGLLFDHKLAAKAGIVEVSSGDLRGVGDWGALRGASAIAPLVSFGPLRYEDCPIRIADTRSRIGERGVVGADFFSDFVLRFDFGADRLHLEPLLPLPRTDGVPELADRKIGPQHAGWTPVRLWYGDILVETRIDGERSAWFVLDTGGQFNLVDTSLASELVQLKRYNKLSLRGFSGQVQEVFQAQQRVTLSFAGLEQGNDGLLAMDLSPLSSGLGLEIGGILGYELLRHLDVAIDYRNALVRLRPR